MYQNTSLNLQNSLRELQQVLLLPLGVVFINDRESLDQEGVLEQALNFLVIDLY